MKIKTAIFATLLLTGCDLKELGIDIPKRERKIPGGVRSDDAPRPLFSY